MPIPRLGVLQIATMTVKLSINRVIVPDVNLPDLTVGVSVLSAEMIASGMAT